MMRAMMVVALLVAACGGTEEGQQPQVGECYDYTIDDPHGWRRETFCPPDDWQGSSFCWRTGGECVGADAEQYNCRSFVEDSDGMTACKTRRDCEPEFIDNPECCGESVTEAHDCG